MAYDIVEVAAYRIRAIMMHGRNLAAGMWKIPTRYQALKGIVAHARLDAPPKQQQQRQQEEQVEDEDEDLAPDDGLLPFEALQDMDGESSSEPEVVYDSSFVSEPDLDELLGNLFKQKILG